jgi:hypothetical protein
MLIFVVHRDGSSHYLMRRDADFDIETWTKQNEARLRMLGTDRVFYELI